MVFFQNNEQIPYGVCIYYENKMWIVYSTDERCVKKGLTTYSEENEACLSFYERLCALNRFLRTN